METLINILFSDLTPQMAFNVIVVIGLWRIDRVVVEIKTKVNSIL